MTRNGLMCSPARAWTNHRQSGWQHTLGTLPQAARTQWALPEARYTQSKQLGLATALLSISLLCLEGRGITICHAYRVKLCYQLRT